jgi:hypothetical protein
MPPTAGRLLDRRAESSPNGPLEALAPDMVDGRIGDRPRTATRPTATGRGLAGNEVKDRGWY